MCNYGHRTGPPHQGMTTFSTDRLRLGVFKGLCISRYRAFLCSFMGLPQTDLKGLVDDAITVPLADNHLSIRLMRGCKARHATAVTQIHQLERKCKYQGNKQDCLILCVVSELACPSLLKPAKTIAKSPNY